MRGTVVFTASGGKLKTLMHELTHGIGFHHICGNWDFKSNSTTGTACAMHYDTWYFMLDDSSPRKLEYWTLGFGGEYYCEEHIIEVRKQNLETVSKLDWGN